MTPKFSCLSCGSCCRRIVIKDPVEIIKAVGLCLRPEERDCFEQHPETKIVPYIGIKRKNVPKIKVLLYQMVSEPCPMLDIETNQCTIYDKRPMMCRAYPFILIDEKTGIENNCTSIKPFMKTVKFGETEIEMGLEQRLALIEQVNLFENIGKSGGVPLIFDYVNKTWIGKKGE